MTTVTAENNALDESSFQAIDELVSNGGFYRVKIVDQESGASVLASVPGCDVQRAKFRYVQDIRIPQLYELSTGAKVKTKPFKIAWWL